MAPLLPEDWDRDKVWNNIEKELRKKKRRRGLWLFWIGLGVVLAIPAVSLWLGQNQSRLEDKEISAIASPELPNASAVDTCGEVPTIVNGMDKLTPAKKPIAKTVLPLQLLGNVTTNNRPGRPTPQLPITSRSYGDLSDENKPTAPIDEAKGGSRTDNNPIVPTNPITTLSEDRLFILPILESLPVALLDQPDNAIQLSYLDSSTEKHLPLFLRLQTSFGTGRVAYEGPDTWIQAKTSSESFEYAASGTIGVDWYFAKKWYAFSGLSYQLIRSRYEFESSQATTQPIESDSAIVFQLAPGPFYQPGTLEETITTKRFIIHNNALHRFSLQLGIGFVQPIDRLQLEARVGTRFPLWQRFDGVALDENTNQHLLDNNAINERYYQNGSSLDLTTALLLNYPLKPGNYLILGVQYEQSGIIQTGAAPYQTDYRLWSAQVGWKFKW